MKEECSPYRNTQYLIGLVADQNPGHPANAWWFHFFGRPTPFVKGPARAALLNKTEVVFAFIHKPRRGYYEAVFSQPVEMTADMTEQELTRKFVIYLEDVLRKYPDMWLWSHRRWKHEWKPEYGDIIA
jgi:KDO2-lipid IV(A) lauroyltransferase